MNITGAPKRGLEALPGAGFRSLMNDAVTFDRDGGLLALAGVPDLTSLRTPEAFRPISPEQPKDCPLASRIFLSHQRKRLMRLVEPVLTLNFPGIRAVRASISHSLGLSVVTPYVHGLYNVEGVSLYVNKGAGFWGPPLRSGGPGEITLLTLRRAE